MAFRQRFLSSWIVSSDGYRVRYRDRASWLYEDPGRRAVIGAEVDADGRTIAVFSGQVWLNGSAASESDDEVVERVTAALRWSGYAVDVV